MLSPPEPLQELRAWKYSLFCQSESMAFQSAVKWLATTSTMMRMPCAWAATVMAFRSSSLPTTKLPMEVFVG